jgi:hypothetical protein
MEPHVFDDGRIVLNVIVLDITETLKEWRVYYKLC